MATKAACLVKLSRHRVLKVTFSNANCSCTSVHLYVNLSDIMLVFTGIATPVAETLSTIKALRSPQRPRASSKVRVQQAASPISKADRNGSVVAARVSSSDESGDDSYSLPDANNSPPPAAGMLWRNVLLVSLSQQTIRCLTPEPITHVHIVAVSPENDNSSFTERQSCCLHIL